MICWWCTWGWPSIIADIYEDAVDKLDGDSTVLLYGPAHIVWEDENFDAAQYCIDNFNKFADRLNEYEKKVVMESLVKLAAVPNEYKTEPYNGDEPETFSPPKGWNCRDVRRYRIYE